MAPRTANRLALRDAKAHDLEKKRAAAKLSEGQKRIGCEVPDSIYRQVRVKLGERGISFRKYFLELLAKEGIS